MKTNTEKSWRCEVCGYIHYGETAPEKCPICNAKQSDFKEIEGAVRPTVRDAGRDRIVIVGAGIAGVSAAASAREHAPNAEIVLISKETELPYYRLNLTRLLAGEISDADLPLHPQHWFEDNRIDLMPGTAVEEIILAKKAVRLPDGSLLSFDKLIVATGSHPFIPPIPGMNLGNVYSIREAGDVRKILKAIHPASKVVCLGGGILGLETAGALARHKLDVTVLEAFDYLMPRQLNEQGSNVLRRHLDSLGIKAVVSASADCIVGDGVVTGVHLKRGQLIPADILVVVAGDRANASLLQAAGLTVKKGVLVDNFLRTTNPDIFAVGDVCEHDGILYGAWAAAMYQGKIAGMNAAGVPTEFGGIPRSHLLKVLGKPMLSIGTIIPTDGSYQSIEDSPDNGYRMFMFRDGCLVGALLIGKLTLAKTVRKAIQAQVCMGELLSGKPTAEQVAEALSARFA